ncbi:hypothetical protein [Bradyrhizobium iriomotense]|uniref:hypothetical protein n=1 Tax=Bradyrhizobium iriomotense TaxID=441950 RepID=UPI001B8A458A|nr:hypothetical protein [Bradyrhizobium iriomotense]MBR1133248.1 hypothetical protein [Bradyrhizobium iriomotense]
MKRVLLPLMTVLTSPATAETKMLPMQVATNVAVLCDQLVASQMVDALLRESAFQKIRDMKNCVALPQGTRLNVLGTAPDGYVYVIKPPDAHGAWTRADWLIEVKETVGPAPSSQTNVPPSLPSTLTAPSTPGGICDLVGLSLSALSQRVAPETFLREITLKCKSGDLISFPSGYTYVMKKACDFSQQIVTTAKEIQCVYSGALRPG